MKMLLLLVVVLLKMMSILTYSLPPALSIHIFLTFHLRLLPSLYPYCNPQAISEKIFSKNYLRRKRAEERQRHDISDTPSSLFSDDNVPQNGSRHGGNRPNAALIRDARIRMYKLDLLRSKRDKEEKLRLLVEMILTTFKSSSVGLHLAGERAIESGHIAVDIQSSVSQVLLEVDKAVTEDAKRLAKVAEQAQEENDYR